jgi:hypothetical protein
MELRISINDLKNMGLTLTQYVFLWGLYNQAKIKYLEISQEGLDSLIERLYLAKNGNEYVLLENAIEVFEPHKGLFNDFLNLFPTRVSNFSGETRILSPAGTDTVVGKKLKSKFYRITKNNVEFQKHVLKCLEQELNLRKKEGNLYWMRNCETWLNKATWEDYEYLLDKPIEKETGTKLNQIRL